ncbi:collagen alpha-4(VI) chain-like [Sinocyclocheilus grahami]|uniref:collagen alpha-4(VI) chain-like n=1 Tax=Sinocyclocheilus grahami TaxID=75366 RepID=UPI0007ACFDFF|nr:PREDICTED: collagen alpha-4(VI) chain-like [Sinocyclocheilus grahami]
MVLGARINSWGEARGVKCRGADPSPGVSSKTVDKEKQALMSPRAPLQLPAGVSSPGFYGQWERAPGCNQTAQADIVLLVDSSGSIGESDFEEVRKFLHSFVDRFNLRPDKVRVGLAQFSDRPYQEFLRGDYSDKRDLHQKLNDLIYRRGGTNTGLALTFIRENYFRLARQNVPGIAIVITDGESNDDVEEPSQRLRNLGVSIFVIRVGTGNMEKLHTIANTPHEEFLFSIDNYKELQGLKERKKVKVCFTVTLQSQALSPITVNSYLLLFVLNSASRQEQQIIRTFLPRLLQQLNVGKNTNRVGLAQFSENVKEEFLLNTDKARNEILSSIRSLTLRPTGEPGESADGVVQASRTIKTDAVTVFGVGLSKADAHEMKYISSQPHSYKLVGNIQQVQQKIKSAIDTWEDAAVAREF